MDFNQFKKDYFFSEQDIVNLKKLGGIFRAYQEEFANDFYSYLINLPEGPRFFDTETRVKKRKETIKLWLESLFSGNYETLYWENLSRVGKVHVAREIPIHLVTASMSFKRDYLLNILRREVNKKSDFESLKKSLLKILDMNLDVILSSYHEERLKQVFLKEKMDNYLINLAERFAYGLNMFLVFALLGLSLGVVALFGFEIFQLFTGGIAKNLISALGTLLVIWVMIELLKTETEYLRGERFHIEVFLSVALVAFIRELLIASLSHEKLLNLLVFLLAVLVLGIVYFLITKTRSSG